MTDTQIAYLAGFLTGRGAFGVQDGRSWMNRAHKEVSRWMAYS